MWTYVRGERINLDVLFESILLNGPLKHAALLQYLIKDNNTRSNTNVYHSLMEVLMISFFNSFENAL
jgi:hypothetical protein